MARDHGVLPHVRLRTEVLAARFDEAVAQWQLELSDGATPHLRRARHRVRPAQPAVAAATCRGSPTSPARSFHSAQWDHDHDLTGARVAVLGTGASAIQFVPEVAPRSRRTLTVFQRSAPYVLPKPDRAYGPRPQAALARVPGLLTADRLRTYLMTESRSLGFNTEPRLLAAARASLPRHLERQVPDPALRAGLTPTDPIGCKRILQSDDWYPALTLPHVELVTERRRPGRARTGVRTADGIAARGRRARARHRLRGHRAASRRWRSSGRGGRTLREAWRGGAEAHLGTLVAGFPNLFLLYGPNTNLGHTSIVLMLEAQVRAGRRTPCGGSGDGPGWRCGPRCSRPTTTSCSAGWRHGVRRRLPQLVPRPADGRNTQNWPGTTLEFRLRPAPARRRPRVRPRALRVQDLLGPGLSAAPTPGQAGPRPAVPAGRAARLLGASRPGSGRPRRPYRAGRRWAAGPPRSSRPGAAGAGPVLLLHGGAFLTC